jgi:short-subunit dehydrogenase
MGGLAKALSHLGGRTRSSGNLHHPVRPVAARPRIVLVSSASLNPAVVVTGASSGIGRELARLAAGDGSFMVLVGLSPRALNELVAELAARGVPSAALLMDLTDPQAGGRIEAMLAQHLLYCDVLVNSAGFGMFGSTSQVDRTQQLRLLDVNARALTDLTLRFLPGMIERRRGGVLNLGSMASYAPGPYMAAYFASKAYVRSFSSALSAEVAGTGVTVTCLNPGVVRTAFFDRQSVEWPRLFQIVPGSNASDVAAVGWRSFKAGKTLVIPGLANRILVALIRILPVGLVLRLTAVLMRLH